MRETRILQTRNRCVDILIIYAYINDNISYINKYILIYINKIIYMYKWSHFEEPFMHTSFENRLRKRSYKAEVI